MKAAEGQLRSFVREAIREARIARPPVGPGSTVPAALLSKGMKVVATYGNHNNRGEDRVEILGVAADNRHGEEGVKFNSVRDAMKDAGVSSLRALEALEKETGVGYYLVVRDYPMGDQGPWFYLFQGRWCRGSGAERLTFTLM